MATLAMGYTYYGYTYSGYTHYGYTYCGYTCQWLYTYQWLYLPMPLLTYGYTYLWLYLLWQAGPSKVEMKADLLDDTAGQRP
jgi:hypothetical protein